MSFLFAFLGAVSRYLQGNGIGGPGRWGVYCMAVISTYTALLPFMDGSLSRSVVCIAGLLLGANIAKGYTNWSDPSYSLMRYSIAPFIAALILIGVTQKAEFFLLGLIGPMLTLNYFYIGERRPLWLTNLLDNRDVASFVAGVITMFPIPILSYYLG